MLANFTRHRLLQTRCHVGKTDGGTRRRSHFARAAIVPRSLHADDCIILAMQRDPFARR